MTGELKQRGKILTSLKKMSNAHWLNLGTGYNSTFNCVAKLTISLYFTLLREARIKLYKPVILPIRMFPILAILYRSTNKDVWTPKIVYHIKSQYILNNWLNVLSFRTVSLSLRSPFISVYFCIFYLRLH